MERVKQTTSFEVCEEKHDGLEYEVDFYFKACPADPQVGIEKTYNEFDEVKAVRYYDRDRKEILMNKNSLPREIEKAMFAAIEDYIDGYEQEAPDPPDDDDLRRRKGIEI